jgi:hypothetical protein
MDFNLFIRYQVYTSGLKVCLLSCFNNTSAWMEVPLPLGEFVTGQMDRVNKFHGEINHW